MDGKGEKVGDRKRDGSKTDPPTRRVWNGAAIDVPASVTVCPNSQRAGKPVEHTRRHVGRDDEEMATGRVGLATSGNLEDDVIPGTLLHLNPVVLHCPVRPPSLPEVHTRVDSHRYIRATFQSLSSKDYCGPNSVRSNAEDDGEAERELQARKQFCQ